MGISAPDLCTGGGFFQGELPYPREKAQIVDIRSPTSFAAGHIPGSLSIWKEGIPAFIGWFLNYSDPIILVDDFNCGLPGVGRHFLRLGYDNLKGYLAGGFPAWFKSAAPVASFAAWSVQEFIKRRESQDLFIIDVRDIRNVIRLGTIPDAHPIYIGELPGRLGEVPRDMPVAVYCDAGYKVSLGAGILAANGYREIANILGGITAYLRTGYPVEKRS